MKDERTVRIMRMEGSFDRAKSAAVKLEKALEEYTLVLEDIRALGEYYGSDEWKEDFCADERGELPAGLRRGVLSEDGLYGFLEDSRELSRTMRDIVKKLSKV